MKNDTSAVPGLSKRDLKALVEFVENDTEIQNFADIVGAISGKEQGYAKPGDHWLVENIKSSAAKKLINNGIITGGMIPKIENCVDAVQNGVRGVVILDGRKPHSILHEIFSDKGSGTLIRE